MLLASLTKWLSVCLRTKWLCFRVQLQSLKKNVRRTIILKFEYQGMSFPGNNCFISIQKNHCTKKDA